MVIIGVLVIAWEAANSGMKNKISGCSGRDILYIRTKVELLQCPNFTLYICLHGEKGII